MWRSADGSLVALQPWRAADAAAAWRVTLWHCPFSPDGALVAAAGSDITTLVYRVADLEAAEAAEGNNGAGARPCARLRGHSRFVSAVRWLSSRFVATASKDGTARIYDARSGVCSHVFFASTAITCLAVVAPAAAAAASISSCSAPPAAAAAPGDEGEAEEQEVLGDVTLVAGLATGGVLFLRCRDVRAAAGPPPTRDGLLTD